MVPVASLAVASLRSGGEWSLANYRNWSDLGSGTTAAVDLWSVMGRSAWTAAVALVAATVIAWPAAWYASGPGRASRQARRSASLPLGLSAATVGFGFIAAYSGPAVDLRGTMVIIVAVQAAVIAPFMVLLAVPVFGSINETWTDAGAVLGAPRRRRLRSIVGAQLWRPLVAVAGFGFAMALGEFGATTFVARSERMTAPLVIGRLLGRPGSASIGHGRALSVILAALAVAVFLSADVADVIGRRSRRTARPGEPVRQRMLADSDSESVR